MQSLKIFFKRYWFKVLLIAGYLLLLFLVIPIQEKEYVDADKEKIEDYARNSVMIIGGILALLASVFGIRNAKGFSGVLSVIGGGVSIFVLILLCMKPFFVSGYYLINKLYVREKVEKRYMFVKYQQGERYWLLKESNTGDLLSSLDFPISADFSNKNDSDTVRIRFTKGLLGVSHSPEILPQISRSSK